MQNCTKTLSVFIKLIYRNAIYIYIYIYIYIPFYTMFYNTLVVSTPSRFEQRNLHYELERRSMTTRVLADGHHF